MRTGTLLLAVMLAAGLQTTAPVVEPGFTSLFNGQDFTGWQISGPPESFTIQDGAIVANGATSHAYYDGPFRNHSFRDFELKVDAMTRAGSNGGDRQVSRCRKLLPGAHGFSRRGIRWQLAQLEAIAVRIGDGDRQRSATDGAGRAQLEPAFTQPRSDRLDIIDVDPEVGEPRRPVGPGGHLQASRTTFIELMHAEMMQFYTQTLGFPEAFSNKNASVDKPIWPAGLPSRTNSDAVRYRYGTVRLTARRSAA